MYGESRPEAPHATLRQDFTDCRETTLALFAGVGDDAFRHSIDPAFSPIGWHLGHIVYTEAMWLIRECSGKPLPFPELEPLFAVDGLEKKDRGNIPGVQEVLAYAEAVRTQMLECLDDAPLDEQERLWRFVLQHECQHLETVRLLIACRDGWKAEGADTPDIADASIPSFDWITFPEGMADIGLDTPEAMDNERLRHRRKVENFQMAQLPVTQGQFAGFMADGGYQRSELWSDTGWHWRKSEAITQPLHWCEGAPEKPVCGISAYEADAFCAWSGTRLPTEFEWEYAARRTGLTALDGHHGGQSGGTVMRLLMVLSKSMQNNPSTCWAMSGSGRQVCSPAMTTSSPFPMMAIPRNGLTATIGFCGVEAGQRNAGPCGQRSETGINPRFGKFSVGCVLCA